MTPETKLKNEINRFLKTLGAKWWGFKVLGTAGQKTGVPDTVGCYRGWFVAIEAKAPDGQPSPKQLYEIGKIREADGAAYVVKTLDEVKAIFREIDEYADPR